MNKNKALTLTIVANMTANYSESLGNISSIQKVIMNGKTKAKRSKESLKNAIMTQSGFYDDVVTDVDGAAQKVSTEDINISNCRALEGGYMSTKGNMYKRNSSFYLSDAISVNTFQNDYEFHNNLALATKHAEQNNLNVAKNAKDCGLNPFSYEYSKNMSIFSVTFLLDEIGVDRNYNINITNEEKAERIITLVKTLQNLCLIVKGSMDNASPLFVVGGFSEFKTHIFEPLINIKDNKLLVTDSLINKINSTGVRVGMIDEIFDNDLEIKNKLEVLQVDDFFEKLVEDIKEYYK